ncbi:hypothetical protein [Flavobacterium phycosphaerae]|uniref:hypothetical protein n=1 Tax=Flavobacterium phycosphaerae TaxID=2697515 RepID=UPI00138ABFE4|nr:hypothetical protein [Flavobacterium phycosphaerae]
MINQINKLIDINLLLLLALERNSMTLNDFKDDQGNKLQGAKILADIMLQKELIRPTPEEEFGYELTAFGKHIVETGGWLEYLNQQKEMENQTTLSDEFKSLKSKPKKPNLELIVAGLILIFLCLLIASCI